jgi:ATP-dependent Clp protease ATP-binding subunit ClpA
MGNGKLQPLVISAIGVASVIVGALLGHFLSLKEKRVSLLDDARRQAYVTFLEIREKPAELTSVEADKGNIEVEAVRAESEGDKKKAKGLRVRVGELEKKRAALQEKWVVKSRVAANDIAIYGDSRVVRSLANFYRQAHPSTQPCTKEWVLDVQIYQDMRRSLMPEEESVSDKDLAELILGCIAPN